MLKTHYVLLSKCIKAISEQTYVHGSLILGILIFQIAPHFFHSEHFKEFKLTMKRSADILKNLYY